MPCERTEWFPTKAPINQFIGGKKMRLDQVLTVCGMAAALCLGVSPSQAQTNSTGTTKAGAAVGTSIRANAAAHHGQHQGTPRLHE